jgi:hypothetical protein
MADRIYMNAALRDHTAAAKAQAAVALFTGL